MPSLRNVKQFSQAWNNLAKVAQKWKQNSWIQMMILNVIKFNQLFFVSYTNYLVDFILTR